MKSLIAVLAALVLAVCLTTTSARADGISDPGVKVFHDPGPDPIDYNGVGPLDIDYGTGTFDDTIDYTGSATLTSLTIIIEDAPLSATFQCFSDIFADCSTGPVTENTTGPEAGTYNWQFNYSGSGTCLFNNPPGGTCDGSIPGMSEFGVSETPLVSAATPEPPSYTLWLIGLVLLFGVTTFKRLFPRATSESVA